MPSIAFMTAHARFPWHRQLLIDEEPLPGWRFTINEIAEDCAFLVVYDEINAPIDVSLPRERRMVILSEPPGFKRYYPSFLAQFGIVLGPIEPEKHSGRWIVSHPALPWFFGIGFGKDGLRVNLDVETLKALPPPPKINAISVVISKKVQLPKHRARLAFVEALKARLGDRLHIFGRGFTEIDDKAEAILPYAYHLVLENNDIPHFWTEKTADAYLGWAFPVFSGCGNLGAYFPDGSFEAVDIGQPANAIAAIESLLNAENHSSRIAAIAAARTRLIEEHTLFAVLARHAKTLPDLPATGAQRIKIHANKTSSPAERFKALFKAVIAKGA